MTLNVKDIFLYNTICGLSPKIELRRVCEYGPWFNLVCPFQHTDTSAAEEFRKHCDKWKIAQISPFVSVLNYFH